MDDGRSMRAMETTLAASLNTGEGVGLVGRAHCPIPPSSGLAPTNQVTGDVKNTRISSRDPRNLACAFSSRLLQLGSLKGVHAVRPPVSIKGNNAQQNLSLP